MRKLSKAQRRILRREENDAFAIRTRIPINKQAAKELGIRREQLAALDKLPKTLREFIYYAPVNYDPRAVLLRYNEWGYHRTLGFYRRQIKQVVAELNREKYKDTNQDA